MDDAAPRVVFHTASTLNGFLAGDDDELDWLFAVPGADAAEEGFDAFLDGVGAIVMGSATFDWVVGHERLLERPEAWTALYGDRPTFVLSTRERELPSAGDIRLRSGAVRGMWPEIRHAAGAGVVWLVGGGDVVGQFADADLLDEIRVSVAPATLTGGKPLLPRRLGSDRLRLVSATQAGQFAELVYAVAPVGRT